METAVWWVHDWRKSIQSQLEQQEMDYRKVQIEVLERSLAVEREEKIPDDRQTMEEGIHGDASEYSDYEAQSIIPEVLGIQAWTLTCWDAYFSHGLELIFGWKRQFGGFTNRGNIQSQLKQQKMDNRKIQMEVFESSLAVKREEQIPDVPQSMEGGIHEDASEYSDKEAQSIIPEVLGIQARAKTVVQFAVRLNFMR